MLKPVGKPITIIRSIGTNLHNHKIPTVGIITY